MINKLLKFTASFCILFPSLSFAFDGMDKYGEYVVPPALIEYCQLQEDDLILDPEAITTEGVVEELDVAREEMHAVLAECLKKLEEDRLLADYQQEKNLLELSSNALQDYNMRAIAYAAKSKDDAATFFSEPDKDQAKGGVFGSVDDKEDNDSKEDSGDEEDEEETSDLKVEVNYLIAVLSDNARLLKDYMIRQSMALTVESYRHFHQNSIVDAQTLVKATPKENPFTAEIIFEESPSYDDPEFQEKMDALMEMIETTYAKRTEDIKELQQDYQEEFDRYTAKANEESDPAKKAEIIASRDKIARQRQSTISSKTSQLNNWYESKINDYEKILQGVM